MTIGKYFAQEISAALNQEAMNLRGDWYIPEGADPCKYTVRVKKLQDRVQYQVKQGRTVVARFELVMVEV